MGVPSFYRWLAKKYPAILTNAEELKQINQDGVNVPVDTSAPNPNGTEYDNLYLDMNGIIHPCTHPEGKPAPKDEDEMMGNICEVVDRLFSIVRPRKILYLAVDGVAPRAKMNQQRARRFRAAQEAEEKALVEAKIREELASKGQEVPALSQNHFDSNVITPGTAFMKKVTETLVKYSSERLSNDPGWKDVKVIISDASVPGEGEHKIMSYIRTQRAQPDYDPNTKHVICGLDADLIMLGLATHEPHFAVLREEVINFNLPPDACNKCQKSGHQAWQCTDSPPPADERPYQFLHLNILREYLDAEFKVVGFPEYDFERVVDDFILMCFFVGNDFLPHMPTLEIREGAIDLLMGIYKKILPSNGYMTHSGDIDFRKVETLLKELAFLEDNILSKRRNKEQREKQRDASRQGRNRQGLGSGPRKPGFHGGDNHAAADALKASFRPAGSSTTSPKVGEKRGRDGEDESPQKKLKTEDGTAAVEEEGGLEEQEDEVQLGVSGWRDRYYHIKFHVKDANAEEVREVCKHYSEGLAWVMKYYYQGVASWDWYYPYHYAPFAQDLVRYVASFKFQFNLGQPFKPFEQLMAVLPSASHKALPKPYHKFMGVGGGANWKSPILHNYPKDFKLDMNGKKFAWQAVILLPFIDEEELLKTLKPVEKKLQEDEARRNSLGQDVLLVNVSHPIAGSLTLAQSSKQPETLKMAQGGLLGTVSQLGDVARKNFGAMLDAYDLVVASVYNEPEIPADYKYAARLLPTVALPDTVLDKVVNHSSNGYNRGQNSAAVRMINNSMGDNQHKAGHNRSEFGYNYNDNQYVYQGRGGFNNGGRGGGGRGGYNDGGRGGGGRGGYNNSGRGGYNDSGRGGYNDSGRGGRGGYNDGGRGGRGGYGGGGRGGYNDGGRGGYHDGGRGGYDNSGRGGYNAGGRGGYNNNNYNNNNTNNNNSGGYAPDNYNNGGNRGGYNNNRGGHAPPAQPPAHFSNNYNPFAGRR